MLEPSLTETQARILEFIRDYQQSRGAPPTLREIGNRFGFTSTGTVRDHLRALERKGCLRRTGGRARGIELAAEVRETRIPIVGRVAAGIPLLSEENLEGYVSLEDALHLGQGTHFSLRVQGDSMIGAGILEDDLVIVRVQQTAESGEIVVALVDGEATVKRLGRTAGRPSLLPENPAYAPIPIAQDFRILGKVIGVMRHYA